MDNMLYDYDCMIQERKNERFYKGISVWTKLKDKVSLATACFNKSISKIDINTGQPIQDPLILTDEVKSDDLRTNERNSKK
jgi:hypothetical protein